MADRIDEVSGWVKVVEGKVDHLATAVDNLSLSVTQRFDAVDQRFDALSLSVDQRFDAVDQRFDALSLSVTHRFDAVDQRFDALSLSVDQRFDAVGKAIVEQRQYTEFASSQLDRKMDAGFGRTDDSLLRLERKLDQFIDRQLPAPPSAPPEQPR